MIYSGVLPSRGSGRALDIIWDSDTGEFTGRDADRAERFVSGAVEDGYIELLPTLKHPLSGEPLTAAEIGSILNELWIVDDVFPQLDFDSDYPEGAVS